MYFAYCDIFNKIILRPCFSGRIVLTPRLSGGSAFHTALRSESVVEQPSAISFNDSSDNYAESGVLNLLYRLSPDAPIKRTG